MSLVEGGLPYFVGRSEKDICADLEYAMRRYGADRQGFENLGIIVASGFNSASCHHMPTDRKLRKKETLLIDWGAELDGYRSDITRTLFMGSVSDKMADIYRTVQEANRVGIAAIKAGVRCQTVAVKSWNVVRDAGYGETIRHGLGHGLGMNVHERPGFGNGVVSPNAKDVVLRKNMVLTVEPGIYYDGFGGVRIEDDIVVTAKGCKCLTTFPRDLDDVIIK
jgi:Xaa-Pro aminopeptidase